MAILYVVATPIGNLEDFSSRALRILKEVDLILCEDTRTTKKLLNHYQISKPTLSYYQHSRLTKIEYILKQVKQGKKLALVSEAGTPTISDPGANLISYLIKQVSDLKVVPIPGPSALITALSVSGFPADKFIFLGFPPTKRKRKKFFEEVAQAKYTTVFYESPHRILKTLEELALSLRGGAERRRSNPEEGQEIASSPTAPRNDNSRIVVCRELTKKFETIYRGEIEEVIEQIKKDQIKGEFVVIVRKK